MEQPPVSLATIARDTRILSQKLKNSSAMDPTLRQLMSQLLAFERNESEVEGWLDAVGPMLDQQADAHAKEIAALRAELAAARAEQAEPPEPLSFPTTPVDEITGHKRHPYPEQSISGTASEEAG